MTRPISENLQEQTLEPETGLRNKPEQDQGNRRISYTTGNPDSTLELVQFINCKTREELANISVSTLLTAALQGRNTIADWEETIVKYIEQIDRFEA